MNLPTLELEEDSYVNLWWMADYETLMYVVCICGMERYIINYTS